MAVSRNKKTEEKAEQAKLRAEYVASVRANLRAQLDNVEVERPDGTVEIRPAQRCYHLRMLLP